MVINMSDFETLKKEHAKKLYGTIRDNFKQLLTNILTMVPEEHKRIAEESIIAADNYLKNGETEKAMEVASKLIRVGLGIEKP